MTFLVDADLPRSAADVIRRHGYDAVDVRDIHYPPQHYAGIVVLMIPPTATALYITQLLDSFFVQKTLITQLPGKLAIVEPGRVRLRS